MELLSSPNISHSRGETLRDQRDKMFQRDKMTKRNDKSGVGRSWVLEWGDSGSCGGAIVVK